MLRSSFAISLVLSAGGAIVAEKAHAGHQQGSANAAAAMLATLEAREAAAKEAAGPPPWELPAPAARATDPRGSAPAVGSGRGGGARAAKAISRSLARDVALGRIVAPSPPQSFLVQGTGSSVKTGDLHVTFLPSPLFLLASTLALTGFWRAARRSASA